MDLVVFNKGKKRAVLLALCRYVGGFLRPPIYRCFSVPPMAAHTQPRVSNKISRNQLGFLSLGFAPSHFLLPLHPLLCSVLLFFLLYFFKSLGVVPVQGSGTRFLGPGSLKSIHFARRLTERWRRQKPIPPCSALSPFLSPRCGFVVQYERLHASCFPP